MNKQGTMAEWYLPGENEILGKKMCASATQNISDLKQIETGQTETKKAPRHGPAGRHLHI